MIPPTLITFIHFSNILMESFSLFVAYISQIGSENLNVNPKNELLVRFGTLNFYSFLTNQPQHLGSFHFFGFPKRCRKQQYFVNSPCSPRNKEITFRSPPISQRWCEYWMIFNILDVSFVLVEWANGMDFVTHHYEVKRP